MYEYEYVGLKYNSGILEQFDYPLGIWPTTATSNFFSKSNACESPVPTITTINCIGIGKLHFSFILS